ncbi:MAG: sugar ABC transporter permease [Actinomycetales bacterium]|nr:sugar ABC transporter permease [Actinomycetales bacterium]
MTDLFLAISDVMNNPVLSSILAIVFGPLATFGLYWLMNKLVSFIPSRKVRAAIEPYVFIGIVLALIGGLLIGPTIQTMLFSFMNADSTEWVGFRNYTKLFADRNFLLTIRNNVLWIAVVPAVTIILGLLIATLTDKLGKVRERVFKSIIFMPMAISFVAASSIWRLNYQWDAGDTQIGTLNALIKALGGTPVNWIQEDGFALNSLMLMVIVIWANAGFAMTLLSAAVKAVPEETIEAASIDGATGMQAFFRVVLPQIWGTVISVFITVLISSMKIFDVIWGMTGGNFHTNVLGVDFFLQYFIYLDTGKAAAIVCLLMIAIIPVMIYQIRSYRKQEEIR